MHIILTYI